MESEIDEDIATEDALDIDGEWGDINAEGDEFELHMNANENEYQRITGFQMDRQSGPIVSTLLYTKLQHKRMQELFSLCVTNWYETSTCEQRGGKEMWCLGI